MKKFRHSLIFIGLICAVLIVAIININNSSQTSLAYSPEGGANIFLPAILKPVAGSTPSPTPNPNSTPIPIPEGLIYIDHRSVALFDDIPAQYKSAAADIDMVFADRSVGGNISDGLSCLSQPWATAANNCKRYEHNGSPSYSVDPSEVTWSGTYNRSNWDFFYWPTNDPQVPSNIQLNCNTPSDLWPGKLECFLEFAADEINNYDVLSFQYSYLSVAGSTGIADASTGYFANTPGYDVHEMETFEAQHSDKIIIHWTTSLARSTGSEESDAFNDQMRQYAINNDKILFDVADILSHDPDGNPCYDNRDGVAYSFGNNSENYANDGQNYLAICPHYTTEIDGGHLGNVSAGKIRVAKAFWVLMSQIAGWEPSQ